MASVSSTVTLPAGSSSGSVLIPTPSTQVVVAQTFDPFGAATSAVAGLIAGAPAALNTLKELADAIGDDPNYATTLTTALAGKAAKTVLDGTVRSAGFTVVGNTVHMVDISGGSFAANLPAANSLPAGTPVTVKVRAASSTFGSTAVTITPAGSDTIDGSTTGLPLRYANQAKTLVTDGSSNWVPTSGDLTKTVLDALYAPASGSSVYATQTQLGTSVSAEQTRAQAAETANATAASNAQSTANAAVGLAIVLGA